MENEIKNDLKGIQRQLAVLVVTMEGITYAADDVLDESQEGELYQHAALQLISISRIYTLLDIAKSEVNKLTGIEELNVSYFRPKRNW